MKKLITIPTTINMVDSSDELSIDMSNLQFNVDENKKKLYAFIFIRNSGIKATLDFEKCSYNDKEEYLLLFIKSNIEVDSSILASTWIEILSFDENNTESHSESILTFDEIKIFINNNSKLVDEIHQFINSLPLYAIYEYYKNINHPIPMDEFDEVDELNFSLINFNQLSIIDKFNFLLNDNPSDNQKPVFFNNVFKNNDNPHILLRIINNIHYFKILNLMLSDINDIRKDE